VAAFFESGRLAYWKCASCGKTDRETSPLPERLASFNGWVERPPWLIVRGSRPPVSTRRWRTPAGTTLVEGDPSAIDFVGEVIPGLTEAHTYTAYDEDGAVLEVYAPYRERLGPYSDHYWLTRYQVVDDTLVQFVSHCYEESTYDVPNAGQPEQKIILAGLKPLMEG